jgi:hypothetical protein
MKERQSKGRKVEGEEGKFLVVVASASTNACNMTYSSVSGPPALKYSAPNYSFFVYYYIF